MSSQESSLLIYQVMALGEEVADEAAFNQPQALIQLLSRLGNERSCEQNALAGFGIFQVLHEAETIGMHLDPTPHCVSCLADV